MIIASQTQFHVERPWDQCLFNVKAVVAVAAFNQEKALVGAFSVITNVRMDLFEALDVNRVKHQGSLPDSPGCRWWTRTRRRGRCWRRSGRCASGRGPRTGGPSPRPPNSWPVRPCFEGSDMSHSCSIYNEFVNENMISTISSSMKILNIIYIVIYQSSWSG